MIIMNFATGANINIGNALVPDERGAPTEVKEITVIDPQSGFGVQLRVPNHIAEQLGKQLQGSRVEVAGADALTSMNGMRR